MKDPDLTVYSSCHCGSEVLRIEYEPDWEAFDVAIYRIPHKTGWKQKFRYIWWILKTGEPYGDQLLISKEDMKNVQILLNGVLGK